MLTTPREKSILASEAIVTESAATLVIVHTATHPRCLDREFRIRSDDELTGGNARCAARAHIEVIPQANPRSAISESFTITESLYVVVGMSHLIPNYSVTNPAGAKPMWSDAIARETTCVDVPR